ncbi:L,D-transpeptidase [Acidithiobacillus montserratensis]|uniref:L,D-transpeptidase n=1 Tax=Acidithiobacillus montserratensis TaxID=2729135 RepID=A0ACD5HCD0_9PROT|nr:L,D-transpeptidase [Acidithiobacillus montserratensis]MBN2679484.1 L,D-transpeptidase [Acidithiobacillaceae bacterium]MBU2748492.1 L,D-transpeptidase [Acidithiobacillus montserratensis]
MGAVRKGWLLLVVFALWSLAGCAPQISAPPVHSVAYYAAQIHPPVVAPVAPVVSPPISAATLAQPVRIVVSTTSHLLRIYRGDILLATYPVAIGFNGSAPRRIRGDDVTPVGHYHIGWILYGTQYGPFMGLTYPNKDNAEWGLKEGIITHRQYKAIVDAIDAGQTPPQNTPLGGEIGIHGMGPQFSDDPDSKVFPGRWTAGCVALSNWNAQQVAALVQVGTPVEIVGEVRGYRRNLDPKAELAWTKYQHRHTGATDKLSPNTGRGALSPVKYGQNLEHQKPGSPAKETDMDALLTKLGKAGKP